MRDDQTVASRRIVDDFAAKSDNPYEAARFVMRGDMSSLTYDVPVE